mmetsp:Transcript_82120/g.214265  ORF Transcript_82120/g.214265 Transcript_82120/m.214265 type:complete len:248 (+) Transcript_82120:249-992(+)
MGLALLLGFALLLGCLCRAGPPQRDAERSTPKARELRLGAPRPFPLLAARRGERGLVARLRALVGRHGRRHLRPVGRPDHRRRGLLLLWARGEVPHAQLRRCSRCCGSAGVEELLQPLPLIAPGLGQQGPHPVEVLGRGQGEAAILEDRLLVLWDLVVPLRGVVHHREPLALEVVHFVGPIAIEEHEILGQVEGCPVFRLEVLQSAALVVLRPVPQMPTIETPKCVYHGRAGVVTVSVALRRVARIQ